MSAADAGRVLNGASQPIADARIIGAKLFGMMCEMRERPDLDEGPRAELLERMVHRVGELMFALERIELDVEEALSDLPRPKAARLLKQEGSSVQ